MQSQKAGLPGRFMNTIHNNINAVKRHYITNRKEAYIMAIDASKVFDKVNQDMLIKILNKLPLSRATLNAITGKKIYDNPIAAIEVNGMEIAKITCTRGIRQGCPLSMTLYCLPSALIH